MGGDAIGMSLIAGLLQPEFAVMSAAEPVHSRGSAEQAGLTRPYCVSGAECRESTGGPLIVSDHRGACDRLSTKHE